MYKIRFRLLVSMGVLLSWLPHAAASSRPTPIPELPVLNWEPRSDWTSVKTHGAVGDGKADDTEAIQKALDTIQRGVTIYFPPGTYRVTRTLVIRSIPRSIPQGALVGVTLIGHGRETKLVWDGKGGHPLLESEGLAYSNVIGLDFRGGGRASIGHHHCSMRTYETAHTVRHCAFRNFTMAGVYAEPKVDKFAMAETAFENCLFVACEIGVAFLQFNDYEITFDGCEFRSCGTGIRCRFGNFYVRNCHFEESARMDIAALPEHGCSVRRTTSLNSNAFVYHNNIVAPVILENCHVSGWKNPEYAVRISGAPGAPGMLFDCRFTDPPPGAKGAVRVGNTVQRLLLSENQVDGAGVMVYPPVARDYTIPAGDRKPASLAAGQSFFKSEVTVPGKVFDAKRDFGAKGVGSGDDTEAIQKAIDAAREYGNGALAYIPAGLYVLQKTLRVSGNDYFVGGAGLWATRIDWRGPEEAPVIHVENADQVQVGEMSLQRRKGVSVLHVGSESPGFVTYDGLFGSRRRKEDEPKMQDGILCQNLAKGDTVLMKCVVGNLRFVDCADATILVRVSYYGTLIVEGESPERDGFLGVLTRFSGGVWNVLVKNNHSLVMSDYYSENSGNIFYFEGTQEDPPGRVSIQGAKAHLKEKFAHSLIKSSNYRGQVFLGPDQVNKDISGRMRLSGNAPLDIFLVGNSFYRGVLDIEKYEGASIYQLGSYPRAHSEMKPEEIQTMFADSLPKEGPAALSVFLDDLRRLGAMDLKLNHPEVYTAATSPEGSEGK
jgi:hypothetical protein